MTQNLDQSREEKLQALLRRRAPNSIIDLGTRYALEGNVLECSKVGHKVQGIVRDRNDAEHSLTLNVLSANSVSAQCSCSSDQEMQEQWCPHAVALIQRALELDFFDPNSGFVSDDAGFRMNTSSPREIAQVVLELKKHEQVTKAEQYLPQVGCLLWLDSDSLGVQVTFDGEIQEPQLFNDYTRSSSRELDNLLLALLDEHGTWDADGKIWFLSSSSEIALILGILSEYREVLSAQNKKPIHLANQAIEAQLCISWSETGAELSINWIMPDDQSLVAKTQEIIGTGPYWVELNNTIYKLSTSAARIASIFPYSSCLNLTKSQVGPILEAINSEAGENPYISILHRELQPRPEVKSPAVSLELDLREMSAEHFTSHSHLEIAASLDFEYPKPPEDENVVYLPDREKEQECQEILLTMGFEYQPEKRRYRISGDRALDLLYEKKDPFPENWNVEGLKETKKAVRFARLALNVSITTTKTQPETGAMNWFDCHISLVQNNANIPISTLFKQSRGQGSDKWIRLDSGAFARIPGGGLEHLKASLGLLEPNFRLANTIKTSLNTAHAISLSRLDDDQFHVQLDKPLKDLSNKLKKFNTIEPIKPSKKFKGKLRSYQAEGLSWLHFLNQFELGGILADEMGLGKTVQTLALLQHIYDKAATNRSTLPPSLIVAPTSVITNWCYEAQRFTPGLNILLLHGPARKAHFEEIPNNHIVITSYALLRIDRADLQGYDFEYVILDEAQNIKNPQAATSRAAKAMRSRYRLALSGTPTENRPLELWSIFDFLMPGYLGGRDFFKSHFERPILELGIAEQATELLRRRTRPFILRRTKSEVEKDLPDKVESELHVEMTPSQLSMYSQILEEVRPKVFEAVEEKGVRGASVSILAALLRLRQVCNHPNSIEAFKNLPGYDSGKFQLLQELLSEALESGRKILVFSQFREMLSIMRRWLEEQNTNYLYLDGATKNRQDLIDQFNTDENVRLFLISLKAGGTGLNLTAADTVIIYDPWWNPAVESQAVDRAHRIGQTKRVNVYRLVTENSIEQKIMSLKSKKEKIVEALINENSLSPLSLTKTELTELFATPTVEE